MERLWYLFVLGTNILSLLAWIQKQIPQKARAWTLRRVILIDKKITKQQKRIHHFLRKYLDTDGKFS